ncbi:unnamed protein product [Adineta ricciae]|uniref:Uncharacterized protein n=1 Tax=Adineta ricciae TaxID=249248 RepID=A0A815NJX0_ADIRI|nr:unnamed protein product [Adineta ricciae]
MHNLNLFEQEKHRIYSHAIRVLQTSKPFTPSSSKQRHIYRILHKAIHGIFFVCFLSSSIILLWMIVLNIEGIHVEAKLRDSIENASSDLIVFTECTTSVTLKKIHLEDEIDFFTKKLNRLLNSLSNQTDQIRFNQIWNRIFIDLAERLRIWATIFDFRIRFTKLVILLPHVAGACSACNNFKTTYLYNSLFYASEWFNSTFPSIINNETTNTNQMIQDCQQKVPFWTMNDLIHKNFHYLTASLLNMLSHLILYVLSILLRRYIQNHKCQFARWNIPLRTSSFSVIRTQNENNHDDNEIEQGV